MEVKMNFLCQVLMNRWILHCPLRTERGRRKSRWTRRPPLSHTHLPLPLYPRIPLVLCWSEPSRYPPSQSSPMYVWALFNHVVLLELHPTLCFIHFIINQLIVALNVTENCIHNFNVFKYPVNNDVKQRKSSKPLVCLARIRMFDKLIVLLD